MARPPLAIGTHGRVADLELGPTRYRARVHYRGQDGVTRTVDRFGQTKKAAREALQREIARRQVGDTALDRSTRVGVLLDQWLAQVDKSTRAAQTKDLYRYLVEHYIRPRLAQLRIGEATTGRCDRTLQEIAEDSPGVARSVRAVLNGVFKEAIRQGALPAEGNPIRNTTPISGRGKLARALLPGEVDDITDRLRTSQRALDLDLPDLVDFALDTGCRIGELLAIRETDCDLAAATVLIRGTVVRRKGQGLSIQDRTKSAAGERLLPLPPQAVGLLERRRDELRLRPAEGVVFGSPYRRTLRDPSNAAGDLRELMRTLGYPWVTFHSFRKTVATRLDQAGLTANEIADQLGHSNPSMTQNAYIARKVASRRAADALAR